MGNRAMKHHVSFTYALIDSPISCLSVQVDSLRKHQQNKHTYTNTQTFKVVICLLIKLVAKSPKEGLEKFISCIFLDKKIWP